MILKVENITSGYGKNNILNNINFCFETGDILCIMGENGSGKSTLFKSLLGFVNIKSGKISINDENILNWSNKKLSKYFSYIPQIHTPSFDYKVIDIVLMGRAGYLNFIDLPSKKDNILALECLKKVGIEHLYNRIYTELSGGERKLVLIARALCQDAKYMIMDEPTSDLDFVKSQIVYDVLKDLSNRGYGIIISTHSPEYPFYNYNKLLLLKNGNMISFGTVKDTLNKDNLTKTYSTNIDVIDIIDSKGNNRKICISI